MKKEMICIVCPIGCRISAEYEQNDLTNLTLSGNQCKRGKTYVLEELTHPTRAVSSTVVLEGSDAVRLPVKTDGAIPKQLMFDCMDQINRVRVQAPVRMGDVIIENVLGTGVNIVATRSFKSEDESSR